VSGVDPQSVPGPGPGAIADQLRGVLDGATVAASGAGATGGDGPVPLEDLRRFRRDLEVAADRAVALLDGHSPTEDVGEGPAAIGLPLRLPKGRVIALTDCERFAFASARPDPAPELDDPPLRLLAGRALDVYVEHEIVEGPIGHPLEDLLSWLDAEGEHDVRDQVIAAGDRLQLERLASAARAWSGLAPSWWPRTQARAAVHLADGLVLCEGRTDVELGGPLAGRPAVVVEVKLGRPHAHHLAEATHYALLTALRDGRAPAAVARWYPGGALATMSVTSEVLESAARRLGAAIDAWAELAVGRPPRERPGPACSWCPDAGVCPSFAPAPDPFGVDA